jgi:uncharacterized protein YbjQ (UPF0145 family)
LLIVTSSTITGKKISETLGLVEGSAIRARHIGNDIMAGLRNLVGGEIREYAELIAKAREEAISRMSKKAEKLAADAIVDFRFSTTQVMGGAAEILAYGTAVKLEDA